MDLQQNSTDLEMEDEPQLVELLNIIVDKGQEIMRIDKFLFTRLVQVTRTKIQHGIDNGFVFLNDKVLTKSNYKIKPLDKIVVYTLKYTESTDIVPEEMPLNIVYEDEHVLLINKPSGMVVHPGSGNYTGTLVNGVAFYLQKQSQLTELPRIGLLHRIDKDTSGLLLFAKTDLALLSLSKQFKEHTIKRLYKALVWGDVEQQEGTIEGHIGRNVRFRKRMDIFPEGEHGKHAITHYKVLQRFYYTTLVECKLETGRTHQIRVHMKYIGHTLFNDATYGGDAILKGTVYNKYKQFVENCFSICPRQALHAYTLGFVHPVTQKLMHFEVPLPEDMQTLIDKWKNYSLHVKN